MPGFSRLSLQYPLRVAAKHAVEDTSDTADFGAEMLLVSWAPNAHHSSGAGQGLLRKISASLCTLCRDCPMPHTADERAGSNPGKCPNGDWRTSVMKSLMLVPISMMSCGWRRCTTECSGYLQIRTISRDSLTFSNCMTSTIWSDGFKRSLARMPTVHVIVHFPSHPPIGMSWMSASVKLHAKHGWCFEDHVGKHHVGANSAQCTWMAMTMGLKAISVPPNPLRWSSL